MSRTRKSDSPPVIPIVALNRLEVEVAAFAGRTAARIQASEEAYAGPVEGRRSHLITLATARAAGLFVGRLRRPMTTAAVDELFRRMGYGEAQEGHPLEALERALRIAGEEAWDSLQAVVVAFGLPARALVSLDSELKDFLRHLANQAATGHEMGTRDLEPERDRARLMAALCSPDPTPALLAELAQAANLALPERFVVISGRGRADRGWPRGTHLDGMVLSRMNGTDVLYLADGLRGPELIARLAGLDGARLTFGYSIVGEIDQWVRWTRRALDLAERGVIPLAQVTDVARHRTQLWLHSEPAVRRDLAQELLGPLFSLTPAFRCTLAETLLVSQEVHGTDSEIGAVLGVHDQTVRYRWRKIRSLFGDSLHDPEFMMQLTMVLKASLPLWEAGDDSDLQLYLQRQGEDQLGPRSLASTTPRIASVRARPPSSGDDETMAFAT